MESTRYTDAELSNHFTVCQHLTSHDYCGVDRQLFSYLIRRKHIKIENFKSDSEIVCLKMESSLNFLRKNFSIPIHI